MTVDLKYEKCETCKYFLQHYVMDNSRFIKTCCGHCINSQLNGSEVRNKGALHENCGLWEWNGEEKAERKKYIKITLAHMQKHLSEIASILKNDSE